MKKIATKFSYSSSHYTILKHAGSITYTIKVCVVTDGSSNKSYITVCILMQKLLHYKDCVLYEIPLRDQKFSVWCAIQIFVKCAFKCTNCHGTKLTFSFYNWKCYWHRIIPLFFICDILKYYSDDSISITTRFST
jgi:hypothetical protein